MLTGYKTLIFGGLLSLLGFLQAFDFTTIITDKTTIGYVTGAIGILVMVLRSLTSTPVASSTPVTK